MFRIDNECILRLDAANSRGLHHQLDRRGSSDDQCSRLCTLSLCLGSQCVSEKIPWKNDDEMEGIRKASHCRGN